MEDSRRKFIKKAAIITAGTAIVGGTLLVVNHDDNTNKEDGVNVGKSKKKEVLYKKTAAWEEFYKQAQ